MDERILYKTLYYQLRGVKDKLNHNNSSYNYLISELNDNLIVDKKGIYVDEIRESKNNILHVKDKLTNQIIPDIYNRM